jgi:pimeloyl-ACP methyl ester carboxylesterase
MPPQLVLMPGLDGTGDLFRNFLEELPGGYQRSVVSYPAHLSSYLDLAPIVQSAIPDGPPYVLVAESFSSPLAIQIASSHPGYLRGLILCGGFAAGPVSWPVGAAMQLAAGWIFRRKPPAFAIRRFLAGPSAPADLIDPVRNAVGQASPRVLADRLRQVLCCDVREDVSKIWVPILCVRGSEDRLIGEECVREILSRARREESRSVTIDGPHLLLQAQPVASVDAIADFLHHRC